MIIGPNTIIATTNHAQNDHTKIGESKGVTIGNDVWIGANCSIVPGARIGNNVTIGAGCNISTEVPSNVVVKRTSSAQESYPKKGFA